jgi:hypothetical protein
MKQQTYWQKRNHTAKQTYRTQLQNNKETRKTKNSRTISPRGYYTIQKNTVAKHQIHMGNNKNKPRKQWHFSSSTQVTTVLQHTSIALTFLVITTAQYANKKTQ